MVTHDDFGVFAFTKLVGGNVNDGVFVAEPDVAFMAAVQFKCRNQVKVVIVFGFELGVEHFAGVVAP